jgi:hypothetical protein
MEQDPPTLVLLCAFLALAAVIAIPSIINISTAFKRSRQWQAENGHDRAERLACERYRKSDPEGNPEKLRELAPSHH